MFVQHPEDSPYRRHLEPNAANYAPLTPLSFLDRAADIHPAHVAVVHGGTRLDYAQLRERCRRLASALTGRGVRPGDTVAVMAPNIPAMVEAHYGVPGAGAVLNALNIRLESETLAYILAHSRARVLIADTSFADVLEPALATLDRPPLVVDIEDTADGRRIGAISYEELLAEGDAGRPLLLPADEWQAISLNYTSGTTGRPKGVVYHHRGAYLNAVGNSLVWSMPQHPVYLWTLPMFHCNGWCFPWGISLQAGTHVCLRKVEAGAIWSAFADEGVTHLCGAPIVMSTILNAPEPVRRPFAQPVRMMTAASAPPAALLEGMAELGIDITHVYGLTEVYGPATVCAEQPGWAALPSAERARLKARQGVRYPVLEGLAVMDAGTMTDVPADGATIGEIMMRGHIVMKGYLDDPAATEGAFQGGWFHTGDLAVMHEDGYVEIKDRAKDIIISGGENISSIEVEGALFRHPAVLDAAVVAMSDVRWGEVPCAFVELKDGQEASEADLIRHCRDLIAHFKAPKRVIFGDLPKTSTGKIQKAVLRARLRPDDR
ncbi:acyl-CoA synthetase [Marinivivus vitaminiproducens]|uniref:acyl-CoA synthetase n=1 Tax=Marinivivus vitaminiproducens TaxID=3035935 RepID=UPI0027AA7622|nr:acyl-CoA synthetase [Geminicoccaceae bacterium SCSIO 64248]